MRRTRRPVQLSGLHPLPELRDLACQLQASARGAWPRSHTRWGLVEYELTSAGRDAPLAGMRGRIMSYPAPDHSFARAAPVAVASPPVSPPPDRPPPRPRRDSPPPT